MINLPAYSGASLLAILLGDLLLVLLFALAAGPVFVQARDAFGRPIEQISLFKRAILVFVTIVFAGYLALQFALVWGFAPYYFGSNSTVVERIVSRQVYPTDGAPVARWITTENHRFGVTPEIYESFAVGDVIEAHFRPLDDTLYNIELVCHVGQSCDAAPSPSASPETTDAP